MPNTTVTRRISIAAPLAFAALLGTSAALSKVAADDSEHDSPGAPGECVKVSAETRYRAYGYDHIVHLESACDAVMTCQVKSDSNPEATQVELEPKAKKSLVLFRGSPARSFKPDVQCTTKGNTSKRRPKGTRKRGSK
ncbi:MAG: hypothetical protein OEZ06_04830 [Myxococcales bacterium]|nr:hypothetical protein [Myxococcales bacterium]